MKQRVECWKLFTCKETECPVYQSKELRCWLVSRTHCREEIQGKFLEKIEMCLDCEVFNANIDPASWGPTLEVAHEQFIEYRRMVEERDRELQGISMELALGLSEVFEALRRISAGDSEVRMPETSDLELITKLKQMVNLTAADLAEIVDISHEFAMGLAEHFDVLNRVAKGDLTARVSGTSQVELIELLKHLTNKTIESVHREMTERKRVEEELKQYRDLLEELVKERTVELTTTNELLQQEVKDGIRKKQALRLSEERYRALFMNNPIETIIVDRKGTVTGYNQAIERASKEKPGGRVPKLGDRMYTKDYAGKHKINMRKELKGCLKTGKPKAFSDLKYGDTFFNVNISPFSEGAIVTSIDITQRKHAEEKQQRAEERYRAALEASPHPIVVYDMEGRCTYINPAFSKVFGWITEELTGKKLGYVPEENWPETQFIIKTVLSGKSFSDVESRRLTKDGNTIDVSISGAIHLSQEGTPVGSVHFLRDITSHKIAERQLKERQEELQVQAQNLQEVNIALKVLLKQRTDDRIEVEEKVLSNMKELILPYVNRLKNTGLDARQMGYVNIIESNMSDIVSPFLGNLSSKYLSLTPREIQIADLVKHGNTSKDIAQLLDVSPRTIHFHRENLRRKLGLKHKQTNLRSNLLSFHKGT